MRVLFCSAEVAPFAKVGGLADVAGSLPKALQARGHEVRVVMPAYGLILERWAPISTTTFEVRINPSWTAEATVYEIKAEGLHLWLIDGPGFFTGIQRSEDVYSQGRDAYIFFAQAALEACHALNWRPEVVHAHDWHMGFVPVLLRETRGGRWDQVGTCYTIHNLAYQGEFGFDTLEVADLPGSLFTPDLLEAYGGVNFLKSGAVYADQTNTVSPNYAQEIQTPEYGCRLDGLMRHLHHLGRLRGILNGIDVHGHNPMTDPDLAAPFSADDVSGKAVCRKNLLNELGLSEDPSAPVLGIVSRLSNQKGFDLVIAAANRVLGMGTRLVVLGTGDPWAAGELRRLEQSYPDRVRFVEAFDVRLAQRIYAGSDIFLMPSAFEPCGLG
ncbi:MAG: glycogen synthase, partial [Fimbriimonadaceae bacterium]|nr:glycogen synthase [Fimbriimonadaceae bacterium]